jgi:hypothetical protein
VTFNFQNITQPAKAYLRAWEASGAPSLTMVVGLVGEPEEGVREYRRVTISADQIPYLKTLALPDEPLVELLSRCLKPKLDGLELYVPTVPKHLLS